MIDFQSESYREAVESQRQFELKQEREFLRHDVITWRISTPALDKLTAWVKDVREQGLDKP